MSNDEQASDAAKHKETINTKETTPSGKIVLCERVETPMPVGTHSAPSEARLAYLRTRLDREHDLLNARTNVFLVFQAILMASLAVTDTVAKVTTIAAPVLGIFISAIWWYVGSRNVKWENYYRTKGLECEETLPIADQIHTRFNKERDMTRCAIAPSASRIFGHILPGLWLLAWLVILGVLAYRWWFNVPPAP